MERRKSTSRTQAGWSHSIIIHCSYTREFRQNKSIQSELQILSSLETHNSNLSLSLSLLSHSVDDFLCLNWAEQATINYLVYYRVSLPQKNSISSYYLVMVICNPSPRVAISESSKERLSPNRFPFVLHRERTSVL
ncbi:hypothetical protein AVEN_31716-1 [Araneus ventricosus]|uniref:Uncharacterized protein n=1 Tax=Araneus ventricosus TaxID=182803 RepID=A0A4Y2R8F7_ARAVE|nr:hypothetical protein AVEN_31716-1 [Araneus ventricosus]